MFYQLEMTVTESGDIQIPVRLKERHFIESYEPKRAIIQATGREFTITVWSPRDLIEIGLPLNEWYATRPYARSMSADRINIERWSHLLDTTESDEGHTTILATIHAFDTDWTPKHPTNL